MDHRPGVQSTFTRKLLAMGKLDREVVGCSGENLVLKRRIFSVNVVEELQEFWQMKEELAISQGFVHFAPVRIENINFRFRVTSIRDI